jgi:serine/threonine-protein kinase
VTYLLLTGRHAFDGADGSIVAQEQLDGVGRPPQLLNAEVPPALAQIVTRALEKDPGARGTAAQFQADIERVLRSAQVQEAPAPRSRMWVWLLALIVLALAALAFAWALGAFGGDEGVEVKVPDVTGMTEARAGTALTDAGLVAGAVRQVQSTEGPEGTVVAQSPDAGELVQEGSEVDLDVVASPSPSPSEPAAVAVPDVGGSSQADAEAQLTEAGFTVVVSQEPSDTVPAGDVVSQDPQAGVVATPGSTVRIVVSTGTPTPAPTSSASP